MTPEGRVKNTVKNKILIPNGVWFFMPVQSGYGRRELDFICALPSGRIFFIETKAPGAGKLTEPQQFLVRQHREAGRRVFIIDGEEGGRPAGGGLVTDSLELLNRYVQGEVG